MLKSASRVANEVAMMALLVESGALDTCVDANLVESVTILVMLGIIRAPSRGLIEESAKFASR